MARASYVVATAALLTGLASPGLTQSTATYTYDALGRVRTVTDNSGSTTYTYDAADNRTKVVMGTNRAPVAANDTASVAPGGTVLIPVRANDTDADGDVLTITAVSTPTSGSATISNGSISYSATPSASGTATFTYTVSDGKGGEATATVTVTIQQNRNPTAVADGPFSTAYNTPITRDPRGNDSDPDGDALVVSAAGPVSPSGAGTASYSANSLTFSPSSSFSNQRATIYYTVSDQRGGTAQSTMTVDVGAQPVQVPTASNSSATVAYNSSNNTLTPSFSGGSPTSVSVQSGPSKGTVTTSGTSFRYSPTSGQTGTDTFTFNGSNAGGTSNTATFTVTISPPAAPTIQPATINVAYGQSAQTSLQIGGVYTTTWGGSETAYGSGRVNGTTATYTAKSSVPTVTDTFTAYVQGPGGTASATVTVNITGTPQNHAPICPSSRSIATGAPGYATVTVQATPLTGPGLPCTDADGDAIWISSAHVTSGSGSVSLNGNTVTVVRNPYNTVTFNYYVTDGKQTVAYSFTVS
jgi:YD repeat-containing protein